MSCFLCLSPLTSGVIRILECPDHWVHENCYIIPVNPAAIRCPVCLKQGSSFANGFMYNEKKFPADENIFDLIPQVPKEEESPVPNPNGIQCPEAVEFKPDVEVMSTNLDTIDPSDLSSSPPVLRTSTYSRRHEGTFIMEHWDEELDDHYFSCVVCQKPYSHKAQLKIHLTEYHNDTDDVDVSKQILLRKKAKAERRRQQSRFRKGGQEALDQYRAKQAWTRLRLWQGQKLVANDDVVCGPGPVIPSQFEAVIKEEELELPFHEGFNGDEGDSVVIGLVSPSSTNEEIEVPQKKAKTWALASNMFNIKKKGRRNREHRKVCFLCNPPKVTGYIEEHELHQKHVLECHLGQDGVIACPYCPKTWSILTLRALLSHIKVVHLNRPEEEQCSEEETGGNCSTSIPQNSTCESPGTISPKTLKTTRKRKSAQLKEAQKMVDNVANANPLPMQIQGLVETRHGKETPRRNWRKIKSQLSYRASHVIERRRLSQTPFVPIG